MLIIFSCFILLNGFLKYAYLLDIQVEYFISFFPTFLFYGKDRLFSSKIHIFFLFFMMNKYILSLFCLKRSVFIMKVLFRYIFLLSG